MSDSVVSEIASNCMIMRTRLISRVLTNIYDDELRPFGINSSQFVLLVVAARLAPASRAEIGRYNHQERSTLTRNVHLLLSGGWIEEMDTEVGGRSRPLVLTKAGKDLLHDAAPAWRSAQAKAKTVLSEYGVNAIMEIANEMIKPESTA